MGSLKVTTRFDAKSLTIPVAASVGTLETMVGARVSVLMLIVTLDVAVTPSALVSVRV
jgi:hypothetical protein